MICFSIVSVVEMKKGVNTLCISEYASLYAVRRGIEPLLPG